MTKTLKFALLLLLFVGLCLGAFYGAKDALTLQYFRLPRVIAAVFGGAALAASGLTMQSIFKNPLAGPYVMGVSSGATLGVALVSMTGLALGNFGILPAAAIGAFAVMLCVFSCSRFIKSSAGLLIVGLMIGYLADAVVTVLMLSSQEHSLQVFINWGMGSFSRLTFEEIPVYVLTIVIGLIPLFASLRYLNLAPLGEDFVREHGINEKAYRGVALFAASFLAAIVTAFCGPIAFVGLAVPHIAFGIFKTTNHRVLLPASILIGSSLCVAATLIPNLPLRAFMCLIGAPVVLWVLLRSGRSFENEK